MRRMILLSLGVALLLPSAASLRAQPMAEGRAAVPAFLDQGWTDDDRTWFYTVTQGSQLMPYYWFLALERVDSDKPYLDDGLARFGYLPPYQTRNSKTQNPDALPIGFARDNDPERGPWVGMTCAACHTSQISFPGPAGRTLLQIDGGPANADFFAFLQELAAAVEATVRTPQKFDRFAARVVSLREPQKRTGAGTKGPVAAGVLMPGFQPEDKERLRKEFGRFSKVLTEYVDISRTDVPWGPARLDAFGEIFNRATAIDLNMPENNQPPNAPVSYPFLWDTSWHDFVQWNGSAPNKKGIERLARNVGEVLGVFAHTEIKETIVPPFYYKATVDRLNLLLIEQRLRKLSSPQWPKTLWPIDETGGKAAKGKELYDKYCLECHAIAKNRTAQNRSVNVTLTPLDKIGTDPLMATNASTRQASTGPLEGVRMPPLIGAPLGARESSFVVTGNIVIGAILAPWEALTSPLNSLDDANKKLMRVIAANRAIKKDVIADLRAAIERRSEISDVYREAATFIARSQEALPLQYKARPLNGIWATAPYLHNGSVPNLYQLLLPATDRLRTFKIGSREFDPKNVGFRVDQGPFDFDTSLPGNSNRGHEGPDYGTAAGQLTEEQRLQLLEYLKTL